MHSSGNDHTILLLTYGSRGDVEPYLALAIGLKAAGYRPVLATSSRFQSWISTFDIEACPLTDAVLELIDTDASKSLLEGTDGLLARLKAGIELTQKTGPLNAELIQDCWKVAQNINPDLIVFHPKALAAPHIAAYLDIPVVMGVFQPVIVPTAEFPMMGMEFLPKALNKFSYKAAAIAYGMFRKPINELRRSVGWPAIRKGKQVIFPPERPSYPVLHAISPSLIHRPDDWPPQAEMTGFWQMPKSDTPLSAELETFIEAGEKPVFIGFGSMVSNDPRALSEIINAALNKTGLRAVVAKGWAGLELNNDQQILSIDPTPFDALFPRMAAVVHHGGLGTTATGLCAGVPSVIVPFFGDQPLWGRRIAALGIGPEPIPRKNLSADALAAALIRATTDVQIKDAARDMAAKLTSEDGVRNAIRSLSTHL